LQLLSGDFPGLDAVEQMLKQIGRDVLAADSGHRALDPVEAARQSFPQLRGRFLVPGRGEVLR
jgi:hypothetical protein